jgi:hypothetical protein
LAAVVLALRESVFRTLAVSRTFSISFINVSTQGLHEHTELISAVSVVLEHVEGRGSGTEKDDIAGTGLFRAMADRLFQ